MNRLRRLLLAIALPFALCLPASALKVATLHPLLTDLARQVGGDDVEVVSLMPAGSDPHHFSPGAAQLAKMADSQIVLAMGKGLENYLPKLRDHLTPDQVLLEVGKSLPSIEMEEGDLFACCPEHSHGALDPHWWHSIKNAQRAAKLLAEEFGRLDPDHREAYGDRAEAFGKQLDKLRVWAKTEISKLPRASRKLATAHAAWAYFCKDFGFQSIPVQGLNKERNPSPKYLQQTIDVIREQKVRAVFPEDQANPKVLESLVRQTGVKLGGTLNASGCGKGEAGTFEGMMRHNVTTIVEALK